jgi:hypothetical protein
MNIIKEELGISLSRIAGVNDDVLVGVAKSKFLRGNVAQDRANKGLLWPIGYGNYHRAPLRYQALPADLSRLIER